VVNVNDGGSPGNGTAAAPLLPGPLKQADADKAGQLLVPAQRQAVMQKKPVCAICEAAKLEAQNNA
jgi:type VI secretion system secreted protein VgrG